MGDVVGPSDVVAVVAAIVVVVADEGVNVAVCLDATWK